MPTKLFWIGILNKVCKLIHIIHISLYLFLPKQLFYRTFDNSNFYTVPFEFEIAKVACIDIAEILDKHVACIVLLIFLFQ